MVLWLWGLSFREQDAHDHEIGDASNEQDNRPELGRGNIPDELSAMVIAPEFYDEAPNPIRDHVNPEIENAFFFQCEDKQKKGEGNQENGLEQVCGDDLVIHPGETHAIPGIRFLAIAAPGEETANPPDAVGDANAAWRDHEQLAHHREVFSAQNGEITDQKRGDAPDEAAIESHGPRPRVGASFFDEIVKVLEQEPRDHPDENRDDRVELNRVHRLLRVVLLFEIKAQEPKAKEHPDKNHDGIGVDKAKEFRIHGSFFFPLR